MRNCLRWSPIFNRWAQRRSHRPPARAQLRQHSKRRSDEENAMPYSDHDTQHEPQSIWTKYVWSQDHKVIAIQYAGVAIIVGLIGVGLSDLMRLQLGFPGRFPAIDATHYYQFMTMHGMIMVIYLLTALFLGGFGNY